MTNKPNHWRRAHRAMEQFRQDMDQLFIFSSHEAFINALQYRGMTETDAITEWLRMDASDDAGFTRRFYLKHKRLPTEPEKPERKAQKGVR